MTAKEAARRHFDAAMAHYRVRRYRDAIEEFRRSVERVPNPDVWFNIGRAQEHLGERGRAVEAYERYLTERAGAPDATELRKHIAVLTARGERRASTPERSIDVGSLAIEAEQKGAVVLLDGNSVGLAPIDRILEVTPGQHRLEAQLVGHVPFRAKVDVLPGLLSAAYVDMRPQTRVNTSPGLSPWTWVVGGVSAAALLAGGGFGAAALSERNRGRPSSAGWATASDVSLGTALVFGVAAAIVELGVRAGESPDVERRANP